MDSSTMNCFSFVVILQIMAAKYPTERKRRFFDEAVIATILDSEDDLAGNSDDSDVDPDYELPKSNHLNSVSDSDDTESDFAEVDSK